MGIPVQRSTARVDHVRNVVSSVVLIFDGGGAKQGLATLPSKALVGLDLGIVENQISIYMSTIFEGNTYLAA